MILDWQKGHGVPDPLLKEVKDMTRRFFELPYEEKTKIKMTPASGFRFAWFHSSLHLYIVVRYKIIYVFLPNSLNFWESWFMI